jgi:hypothetical protein
MLSDIISDFFNKENTLFCCCFVCIRVRSCGVRKTLSYIIRGKVWQVLLMAAAAQLVPNLATGFFFYFFRSLLHARERRERERERERERKRGGQIMSVIYASMGDRLQSKRACGNGGGCGGSRGRRR